MKKISMFLIFCLIIFIFYIFFLVGCSKQNNIQGDNNLKKDTISLNGITFGEKATKKMLNNVVCDAPFSKEYNNVGFNVDENDIINYMYLSSKESYQMNGKIEKYELKDMQIVFNNRRLNTEEDLINTFNENYNPTIDENIEYESNDFILKISLKDGKFTNIIVKNKK